MLKLPFVLAFTAMTAFFWGVYGVVLRFGTAEMKHNSLCAFVGVGLAYFLIAVLVPVALLNRKREVGHWSISGTLLSLFAGSVGALGALGVALALSNGGQAIYVMPIVFGGAPVINTLLTSWLNKSFSQIKPLFLLGMILVGLGMVGVLITKPAPKPSANHAASSHAAETDSKKSETASGSTLSEKVSEATAEVENKVKNVVEREVHWLYVGLSIALAVLCWGSYGPFLHLGQGKMGGSRLRPFCCVGIAYFVIAVIIPIVILLSSQAGNDFTPLGMLYSIGAGAAGALGALGIILAFTYGGKPIFVMPLVFGFAPVINTIASITIDQTFGGINSVFIGSVLLGILGAVTVLLNAPKAIPHGKPAPVTPSAATGASPSAPITPNATEASAGTSNSKESTESTTPPEPPTSLGS
jgi:MFS family permease